MSSGAGAAEDSGEVAPPISGHTVQKEEDTVGAIYSEQARIEMGSTTVGDTAADRARIYVAKKKEEMITNLRALLSDRISTYDAIKNHNSRSMSVPNLIGGQNWNTVQPLLATLSLGEMAGLPKQHCLPILAQKLTRASASTAQAWCASPV